MKVYYFVVVAVALMYLFYLAGIDTASSDILEKIQGRANETAELNPSISESISASDIKSSTSIWIAIISALFVTTFLVGTKINAGFVSFQGSLDSVSAGFGTFIFAMFAFDFYNILIYMRDITNGTGWEFHITWILVMPFLVGFAVSIVEFIRGTD